MSGNGAVLARVDGQTSYGIRTSDGALLWSQNQVDADGAIAVGNDRFFIAGREAAPGFDDYAMLDALTGAVLFSGSVPDSAGTGGPGIEPRLQLAVDPAGQRVALALTRLHAFDAASGVELGSAPLAEELGLDGTLGALASGAWLAGHGDTQPLLAEAFDPLALPLWSLQAPLDPVVATRARWSDLASDGSSAVLVFQPDSPTSSTFGQSFLQSLTAADGALQHACPLALPAEESVFALSPDGQRVAVACRTMTETIFGSIAEEVQVQLIEPNGCVATQTPHPKADSGPIRHAWSPDGNSLLTVWTRDSSGVRLLKTQSSGATQWQVNEPSSGADRYENATLAIHPLTGSVWVATSFNPFASVEQSLELIRFNGVTGAVTASIGWNPFLPSMSASDNVLDQPRTLLLDPVGGFGYAVVQSGTDATTLNVVQFSLAGAAVLAERAVPAPVPNATYDAGGSVITSDGSALLVAGWAEPNAGVPGGVQVSCLNLPGLTLRWQRQFIESQIQFAEARLVNDRTLAVRSGSSTDPGALCLLDVQSGSLLAEQPGLPFEPSDASGQTGFGAAGRNLLLAGPSPSNPAFAGLRSLDVAELIGAPDQLTQGPLALVLDSDEADAGSAYWILGSRTGTAPGVALGPVLVPLNVDPYTLLTIDQANQGPLMNNLGLLDDQGTARAVFDYPPLNPALIGLELNHAALLWDPATLSVTSATAALPLVIG